MCRPRLVQQYKYEWNVSPQVTNKSSVCSLMAWGSKTNTNKKHKLIFWAKRWQKTPLSHCDAFRVSKRHSAVLKSTYTQYKQMTCRTISGLVCQPGSGGCHQRSDGCCVILWPCYLLACLLLRESCGTTGLFTSAIFILPGPEYENDSSPAGSSCQMLTSRSSGRDPGEEEAQSHLKHCVYRAGSRDSSILHAAFILFRSCSLSYLKRIWESLEIINHNDPIFSPLSDNLFNFLDLTLAVIVEVPLLKSA